MRKKWIKVFGKAIIVLLLLCLIAGIVFTIYLSNHLRPKDDWNLKPVLKSDATWYSQDGRIIFQAKNGYAAEGTIIDVDQTFDVKVSADMSGYYVCVYLPSFSEDGVPLEDPELYLEEWTFHSKGEDWFIVEVVESTYYEKGAQLTFYMQEKADK